jgi:hypothetical protein
MTRCTLSTILGATLLVSGLAPSIAGAQTRETLLDPNGKDFPMALQSVPCKGKLRLVNDVTYEGVKVSSWNYGAGVTGFDPTPVLSTNVTLNTGCFNAHLSAMVGGRQTYGVSQITLFQVRLTQLASPFAVTVMDGHYPSCYGYGPCVALSAEYDVDMLGANFYKIVNTAPGSVLPGAYRVDVLWTGGPAFLGGAGAIGAAFVLKMYH